LKLDVTDRNNVEGVAKEVAAAFDGRLDVLINNAGYLSKFVGVPDSDPDEWWRDWEVNVKGVYLVTRACWPMLLKSSLKVIINVSSVGATFVPPQSSAYGSTKLVMCRFTEYINQDHGEGQDGMLAVAIHPGGVKTELAMNMPEERHAALKDEPELPGDTFAWLASERREWLGGRWINANWDMEELSRKREEIVKNDLLKVRLAVNTF
jgi:NAD(P)-dependent dehydrogenase (short-subunit alcohol dehydrogenase family)